MLQRSCGPQEIYKDTDYRNIGQSLVKTAMAFTESMAFVLAQITLEGQRVAESGVQLKDELSKQRHENGRLTMQVALLPRAFQTTIFFFLFSAGSRYRAFVGPGFEATRVVGRDPRGGVPVNLWPRTPTMVTALDPSTTRDGSHVHMPSARIPAMIMQQLRNQTASVEQKLREADHKLRLREKELLDLQVPSSLIPGAACTRDRDDSDQSKGGTNEAEAGVGVRAR